MNRPGFPGAGDAAARGSADGVARVRAVDGTGPQHHGLLTHPGGPHTQVDRTRELEAWAEVRPALAVQVPVHGYVTNHFGGRSPENVRLLEKQLGQVPKEPAQLTPQLGLF